MNDNAHYDLIARITQNEFGTEPTHISQISNGICNSVHCVAVRDREYIFRLNAEPRFLLGSHNHIPLFKSKGIMVPDILAEDLSKSAIPIAYQVQNKIQGDDIGRVIFDLSDDQLRAIGADVANVFRQLSDVPNDGRFGVKCGDDRDLVNSWPAEVERVTKVVIGWGKKTGVLDAKLEEILGWINSEYRAYFERVRSYTYFGDISSNNVMVHNGQFTGLVDLDCLAQGDPLEAIGRIKAGWYGTSQGEIYSTAVMDALHLPPPQRKIVTMYALLNKIFGTLENGVQFSQSKTRIIDRDREVHDKQVVSDLLAELQGDITPTQNRIPEVRESTTPSEVPIPLDVPLKPARKPRVKRTPPEPIPVIPAAPIGMDFDEAEQRAEVANIDPDIELDRHLSYTEPPKHPSRQKIMLEASGLSKTYVSDGVGFNALSNVDLRIHQGDCVAIVGKSGSGKSTLMHLLACLDAPTEGYVYVDGDETSIMSEAEKNTLRNEKFGFVFQQFFLNGRDTVFENVVLPMRIRGSSDFDMISDVDDALASVGLSDKADKKAKDLSGGEKQRVCIARALVGKPQVIFADEPTGNLDSNTGAAVEKLLFDLNRDQGITLVIVTHDPELSQQCERIIEMKDGKIIFEHSGEAKQ